MNGWECVNAQPEVLGAAQAGAPQPVLCSCKLSSTEWAPTVAFLCVESWSLSPVWTLPTDFVDRRILNLCWLRSVWPVTLSSGRTGNEEGWALPYGVHEMAPCALFLYQASLNVHPDEEQSSTRMEKSKKPVACPSVSDFFATHDISFIQDQDLGWRAELLSHFARPLALSSCFAVARKWRFLHAKWQTRPWRLPWQLWGETGSALQPVEGPVMAAWWSPTSPRGQMCSSTHDWADCTGSVFSGRKPEFQTWLPF